jgi:Copper type II ascorbate-dependent monooxygenase, C-terminal domain
MNLRGALTPEVTTMKRIFFTPLIAVAVLVAALFASSFERAATTAQERKEKAVITFNKNVAPILFKKCAECHRPGETAPMSLLSYRDARPWAKAIREKVISREMPPWHADPRTGEFSNDRRLNEVEIDTIKAWVDGQAPEGDPGDLPPQPEFVEGWKIGKPDLILQMPEEFTLAATGPDEYHFFEIDPGFTEDKYVQMAEIRPGNRRIVHHINLFIVPPLGGKTQRKLTREESESLRIQQGKDSIFQREGFVIRLKPAVPVYDDGCGLPSGGGGDRPDGSGQRVWGAWLGGFVPGTSVVRWEPGTVKRIPAGSKIIFNVHYSKTAGRVEKDRSMAGLIFAKKPPQKESLTRLISNHYFEIPPGAENHKVTACWTATDDIHLVAAVPHMHYRGKAMDIRAFYPDGRSEALLNVPRYDFSWQTVYYFKRPVAIPKGTRLMLTAHFDNSGRNKYNPDPKQAVRWGDPTYDEMMVAFFEYTIDNRSLE